MNLDEEEYGDDDNDDDECECTERALQILDDIATSSGGTDWATIENKMLVLKDGISRCLDLVQCRECGQEPGISMLLLVIYEKLTSAFEDVAQWWNREGTVRASENQQNWQLPPPPRIALGHYVIDTTEEHRAVLKAIIYVQIQRLAKLPLPMADHSRKAKREAHIKYAETSRRRIKALLEGWEP